MIFRKKEKLEVPLTQEFNSTKLFKKRRLTFVPQVESAECGLACLAMISGYYGNDITMPELRGRFAISLKGTTLFDLITMARKMNLQSRAIKSDLENLEDARQPCILHWNFTHFVVLTAAHKKGITIYDPAVGERLVLWKDVSSEFTGVALELWPSQEFIQVSKKSKLKLSQLFGKIVGLKRSVGQIIALAAVLEFFSLLYPMLMQMVSDSVVVTEDRQLLYLLAAGFTVITLAQTGITMLRTWALMNLNTSLSFQWKANVFTHLIDLPLQYFEKRNLADVVSRFAAVDQIQRMLTNTSIEAFIDGILAIATLAAMIIYAPVLAAISCVTMMLYGLSRWGWYKPSRRITERTIAFGIRQQGHFLETVRGVKPLKLFMRQAERRLEWLALLSKQVNSDLEGQKLSMIFRSINGLLFGLENISIITFGALFVINKELSLGSLLAFLAYKNNFDGRVTSLIDKFIDFKLLQVQTERLSDIVLTEVEEVATHVFDSSMGSDGQSIECKNISFRYGDNEPHVLRDVSFKVEGGESVAIVGPSGCGKTTLMNLMLGILSPTSGQVLVGGIDIRKAGADALRSIAGTVTQDDILFSGTISENISFFDVQADPVWIRECARVAGVAAEIEAMPMGYNTLVGDMGTVLSGGQKQRVLLARALYKRPRILFLDEATSHLDVERERVVNSSIAEMKITRIFIAHRPDTIRSAKRVIELKKGFAQEIDFENS